MTTKYLLIIATEGTNEFGDPAFEFSTLSPTGQEYVDEGNQEGNLYWTDVEVPAEFNALEGRVQQLFIDLGLLAS